MRKLLFLTCGWALALGGCFYPAERGRALETKVDKLTSDNAQLTDSLKASQERLSTMLPKVDEKIAQMGDAMETLDRASRRSGADIGIQLQKTVEDVAQLRGQVETYLYKIGELEAGLKKLQDDTDKRLADMQGPDARAQAEARRRAEDIPRPNDPKKFLALAQQRLQAGELPVARQLFAEFLKKWPKDEGVAEAHFQVGETFYAEEKCPEALYEYGQVATKYPKSRNAPQALLHSSDCFRKTKDLENARAALEEVISTYPRSDAAKQAKVKLAELQKAKKGSGTQKKARK